MKKQIKVQAARNAAFEKTHQKILDSLEAYITDGWAETLAKLLVYMGAERADETLKKLPEDLRDKVSAQYKAIKRKRRTDASVMSAAEFVLKNSGLDGEALAQDATESLSQMQIRDILLACNELHKDDPLLAMYIEKFTLTIKDICVMSDIDIQRFLRKVDICQLVMAMKDEIKVQEKIFKNVSKRAATMMKEDLAFIGLVSPLEIEKAHKEVLKVMKKLVADGWITINKQTKCK